MAERIMVGMSGGVDSAVSALLLKNAGYDVLGVFMKNWDETDEDGVCTAAADYDDMRRTCDVIGIPYYTVNFTKEYQERVFSVFLREYKMGRTPNPDVLCNTEIKFNAFLDFALKAECDRLATGHYARLGERDGKKLLLRGIDGNKDQSYFLCGLRQEMLDKAMFPVGELTKPQVREIARKNGLPVAEKKDSMGICFIGERRFREFISSYINTSHGDIVDADTGKTVGTHEGLFMYTIGQRRGLGIGGTGTGERWFVIDKDTADNTLLVVQGENNEKRFNEGLIAESFNWISGTAPKDSFDCTVRFRYRQKDVKCSVTPSGSRAQITFAQPQPSVAPGQYAVLYSEEECLGGGIISNSVKAI